MNSESKKTILLVEDEAIIAMMEKMDLEKYGYIVHHVTTGEKSVNIIIEEDFPIDLILMDIDLGSGIDGTQAAEQILSHKDIPVVFLSSHTEPEVVEKTEKITSYGYVVKNSGIVVLDASIKMAFKLFDTKNELILSQRQFQLAFEHAALGVCFVSLEGHFIEVNNSFSEIFGYSNDEIKSLSFQDITHPNDRTIGSEFMRKLLEGEINKAIFEKRYITKTNKTITASVGVSLIRNINNEPLYFITQIHDISENKKIEYINSTMAHMLDVAPNSITIHNCNGIFYYANEKTFEIHGYTKDEFMSINLHSLDVPESQALRDDRFKKIFNTGSATFEVSHFKKDGTSFPLEVTAKTVDWYGEECILSIATDISKRKNHEDSLQRMNVRYLNIVNCMDYMICRFLPDTTLTFVNDAYCKMFGINKDELIGRNFLDFIPVEQHDYCFEQIQLLNKDNPVNNSSHYAISIDGKKYLQEWKDYAFFDNKGNVIEIQSVGRNIDYFE